MHQPCQDQFLWLSNFYDITLEAFVRIESSQFSKTMIFFSPKTPSSHKIKPKHQNHRDWLCTSHANINSFCSQTFPTWLWSHFWALSPASFAKPWIRFSPNTPPSHKIKPKHQNYGTWLCTNHAKINSFCSQTSPTSLWRNLWGLSIASFLKPWFLFFTQHTTKSQNQGKTPK